MATVFEPEITPLLFGSPGFLGDLQVVVVVNVRGFKKKPTFNVEWLQSLIFLLVNYDKVYPNLLMVAKIVQ